MPIYFNKVMDTGFVYYVVRSSLRAFLIPSYVQKEPQGKAQQEDKPRDVSLQWQ